MLHSLPPIGVFRIEVSAQAALQDGRVVAEMIIQADVSSLSVCMQYNSCTHMPALHKYALQYILPIHGWLDIQ